MLLLAPRLLEWGCRKRRKMIRKGEMWGADSGMV